MNANIFQRFMKPNLSISPHLFLLTGVNRPSSLAETNRDRIKDGRYFFHCFTPCSYSPFTAFLSEGGLRWWGEKWPEIFSTKTEERGGHRCYRRISPMSSNMSDISEKSIITESENVTWKSNYDFNSDIIIDILDSILITKMTLD